MNYMEHATKTIAEHKTEAVAPYKKRIEVLEQLLSRTARCVSCMVSLAGTEQEYRRNVELLEEIHAVEAARDARKCEESCG